MTTKKSKEVTPVTVRRAGRSKLVAQAGKIVVERKAGGSFVVLSDLHAHTWAAFAKGDGTNNSRLQNSIKVLRASLEQAKQLRVPWVFGGDLVHTAGYSLNVVLTELTDALRAYPGVVKLMVWGNHDARGIGGRIEIQQTVLAPLLRAVPNMIVLDPTCTPEYTDPTTGLTFGGAGYQPGRDLLDYPGHTDVGVYHQTVSGSIAPGGFVLEEGIPGKALMQRHRVAIVGHVHHHQYHSDGRERGKMLLIPGSPEHHNFGDQGEHGHWLITIPPAAHEDVEALIVPSGSPQFLTVDTPSQVRQDGNFYRVRTTNGEEMPSGAVAIGPTPTTIESRDVLKGARGQALLERWLTHEPPTVDTIARERYVSAAAELVEARETVSLRAATLRYLRLYNFCSYGDVEWHVPDGTNLVMGRGKNFPSNGAGKTTLFEAVFWALFGRTTKGLSGDEVIRWGEDECEVQAEFDLDDGNSWLTITRARGKSSQLRVRLEEASSGVVDEFEAKSVNEMTDKLTRFLGITPELYQSLGYFSQEHLVLFASATDGERKTMLGDLIGLTMYSDAAAAAAKRVALYESRVAEWAAVQAAAEERGATESARLMGTRMRKEEWEVQRTARVQLVESQLTTWREQWQVMIAEAVARELEQSTKALQLRKLGVQQELDRVLAVHRQYHGRESATREAWQNAVSAHAVQAAELRSLHAQCSQQEQQLATLRQRQAAQSATFAAGDCPSCRQPIAPRHRELCLAQAAADITIAEGVLHLLQERMRVQTDTTAYAEALADKLKEGVKVHELLERVKEEARTAKQQLDALAQEEVTLAITAATSAERMLRARVEELQRSAKAITTEVNPYTIAEDDAVERLNEIAQEIEACKVRRAQAQEDVSIYDYWRHGFSKQGIQSLLLDEVAVLFNAARGMIFPALTQGVYDVQFSTLSQTRAGEWRERTEFQIYEHGQLVPYAALSGGQRRRVDIGVMLTLIKAVAQWMQVPGVLGMLVLDEVFGFLDVSGAEGLMEVLREVQEQIPSIFVVSHDSQLQALFPNVVVVEQDQDGVSHIVAA